MPKFPPDPKEWLPGKPFVDPPLPSWLLADKPVDKPADKTAVKTSRSIKNDDSDFVLILRKRAPTPPYWLKKYQDKFSEAARRASEKTQGLKGEEKVRSINSIISDIMKGK